MAGTNTTPEPANIDKFAYLKALRGHPLLNGKSGTQLIIRIMVDYADAKTLGSARPAVSTLAADAGMGRTAAKAALHSAIELGFLRVEKEATNRTPAVYSLHMPLGGQIPTVQTVGSRPSGGSDSDPNQINYQTNHQIPPGEAAHDAPSSHLADSDLSVATTRSAVQHEGHGEDEHEEQDEPSSGTSVDAIPPVAASASQEPAKEGAVDPRRLNGRALLAYRWGEDSAARAVHLSMQCAGGLMSEELLGLLSDLDDEFADWCSDYGSRIASRAAWSEREAAGILTSKLRTFDRGIWLAA